MNLNNDPSGYAPRIEIFQQRIEFCDQSSRCRGDAVVMELIVTMTTEQAL
jgi:hypothetical protein